MTYAQNIAVIRAKRHWIALIASLILLYSFPFLRLYYFIGLINYLSIAIIVVLGLQIVSGYCGQISFGQAAFMAVGAYCSTIFTSKLGLPFVIALPLSGLAAGLFGLLGGAASLKIKGFYLAIATIAIHFLTMWLILNLEVTGGSRGLHASPPRIGNLAFDSDESMYFIIVSVMLLMAYIARNLVRSKIGRAFIAIRDNDLAAQVMGVEIYQYKLIAFFISCFYAGIAGSLWAHWVQVVHPEEFDIMHALWYVGMLIIGGMGSVPGAFFGVIFVRALDEMVLFSSPLIAETFPWIGTQPAAALSLIAFGLGLMVFLLYEPRGLSHRWEILKASWRLYPFMY